MSDSLITRALAQACKAIEADIRANERTRLASVLSQMANHDKMDPVVEATLRSIAHALYNDETGKLLPVLLNLAKPRLTEADVQEATQRILENTARGLAK
jgi:hypothetical protein